MILQGRPADVEGTDMTSRGIGEGARGVQAVWSEVECSLVNRHVLPKAVRSGRGPHS